MRADRGRDGGDRSVGLYIHDIVVVVVIVVIVVVVVVVIIIIPDHGRVDG